MNVRKGIKSQLKNYFKIVYLITKQKASSMPLIATNVPTSLITFFSQEEKKEIARLADKTDCASAHSVVLHSSLFLGVKNWLRIKNGDRKL